MRTLSNQLLKSVKQLFQVTEKLIEVQKEINNLTMTELPFDISLDVPEQDGKLLHAMVLCDDKTIVCSLERVLTQPPMRDLE